MRVDFQKHENLKWDQVPLSRQEMRLLFRHLLKSLKEEPEWKKLMSLLGVSSVGSVGVFFCEDEEMRELQKKYRNLDRTTDVLSFPAFEVPNVVQVYQALPLRERSLGDLAVSIPAVERGAKRGRRSAKTELLKVLVHGFLHLLGLDHVTRNKGVNEAMVKRMRRLQKDLLKAFLASRSGSI